MVKSQPCNCANCGKRLFAWMMSLDRGGEYDKAVHDRKQSLFGSLNGNVLEIGPGTGVNLAYFPKNINWIGIEPNPFMHSYLKQEAEKLGFNNIDIRTGTAEGIDAEDNSMDAVVSTLVLCSVPNLSTTLQKILRVLKPGGRFLFIEHVAAPKKTLLRKVQSTIRPVWKLVGDGCHPDRETWSALDNAGFSNLNYEHFRAPVPIVSPHIAGVATK
ncbi:methyltransferase domain-containing protein [Scytonema sp. UIC 10036]|uniref:class I SAM-dependent methyltransferase n=1 Tax=Scytonema sp. UIC 10036 TaxID=2304196 RepID=UPI0012DA2142|nr:class I SAM-dependent methyltransferase [Scytonema sp. UIC 10036]MUG98135.1 methyltransferase domain-containing protein [Scytonema sp. UIC 10036]